MRFKRTLKDIDEVAILYKYLYLDKDNRITFNNGVTDLQIRLTDNCRVMCKNMSFPHLPETDFTETLSLIYCMGIIGILKSQPPIEFPNAFTSRWEEVKSITQLQCSINV